MAAAGGLIHRGAAGGGAVAMRVTKAPDNHLVPGFYNRSIGEDFQQRVAETIRRYGMFAPGQRVGVAVSGGADSMALLHVLFELAPRWNLKLTVLHLDHRLRGEESNEDARFVAATAATLGLPCEIKEVDVALAAEQQGDNLEQAARRARYEFFHSRLAGGALDRVALGHTRSDQAETVLFRLLRGAGTAGLAGIRPVTAEGIVRPLLGVTRAEVEEFLRAHSVAWREDSSNRDLGFARNRIRYELLPALARQWNPALAETLANMAAVAQDEEAYWDAEVSRLAAGSLTSDPPAVILNLDRLGQIPRAVLRRLIRRAIQEVRGDLRRIDFAHVERILELAAPGKGEGRVRIPDLELVRSFDRLRFAPPGAAPPADYEFSVSVPGRYRIPGTFQVICLEFAVRESCYSIDSTGYNTGGADELDAERITAPLLVRNWRPGDRFQPPGSRKEEKMKALFQKARIPSWDRPRWPIMTSGERIVWARRFGVAAGFEPGPACRRMLRVWEMADDAR